MWRNSTTGTPSTRRADIASGPCGAQLWDCFGLVDRLSPLALLDGQWTALKLYRNAVAALLQRLAVRLSAREQQVCALTQAGHNRPAIALALGIAHSSVATLRERACRKPQIHGAGELFALCLQQGAPGALEAVGQRPNAP